MKKPLAFALALLCCLSLFLVGGEARAAEPEEIHLEDLADMDADATFTLEQLLALVWEAYDRGYADGKRGSKDGLKIGAAVTRNALTVDYVLNKNTKKFHYPDCSSVFDIREKNRLDFSGSREEVVAMGYEPCKRCNP